MIRVLANGVVEEDLVRIAVRKIMTSDRGREKALPSYPKSRRVTCRYFFTRQRFVGHGLLLMVTGVMLLVGLQLAEKFALFGA